MNYPNEPTCLHEGQVFKLYGRFKQNIKNNEKQFSKIVISFRYGSRIFHSQEIDLPIPKHLNKPSNNKDRDSIVPILWAQQKIASLSTFPSLFKEEIRQLGLEFKIATENTSLIVLHTLEQFLKHDINSPL